MKTLNFVKVAICMVVFAFSVTAVANLYADASRDSSVDQALLMGDANSRGPLPATAGQAITGAGMFGGNTANPAYTDAIPQIDLEKVGGAGFSDNRANIFDIEGDVRFRENATGEWKEAYLGMSIAEGYEILTSEDSHASITFDANFANAAHIPASTKAEFRSIEPTDIFLADGKIYNILDGLKKGAEWKVTTLTSVSAVRGTWYMVNFIAADGTQITATIDVPDDGEDSHIEVKDIVKTGDPTTVIVPEGNQITFKEGELDQTKVTGIDSKWLNEIIDFLEKLGQYRLKNNGQLPPTGSEFFTFDPDLEDQGGLDQDDTGAIGDEPPSEETPPSMEEGYGEEEGGCEYDCER